jgi:hypothetical protein
LGLRGTGGKQTYVDPEQLELPDVQGAQIAGTNEACDFVLVGEVVEVNIRVLIAPANLLQKHRARQLVVLNKLTMQKQKQGWESSCLSLCK